MTRGAFGKPQKFCETIYGLPANEIWGCPRPRTTVRDSMAAAAVHVRHSSGGAKPKCNYTGMDARSSSCHQSVAARAQAQAQAQAQAHSRLAASGEGRKKWVEKW